MNHNSKIKILFCFLVLSLSITGQQQVTLFYNQNWELTNPKTATYYRFTELNSTGDFYEGKYNDYLVKGDKIVASGEYSSMLKTGDYIEYYLNGNIKKKGSFKDDFPIGVWNYYYPNGQVKMIVSFTNKDFELIECRDSLNKVTLSNGTGYWETDIVMNNESGKLIAKFKKGKKNGDWKYLNKNGKEVYSEEYIDSELNKYDHFGNRIYTFPHFNITYFYDARFLNIDRKASDVNANIRYIPFNWIKKTLNLSNTKNISYLNSKLPIDRILFIKEDDYGKTWIGTGNNGLIKLDSTFTFYNNKNSPITNNYISCIQIDKHGKIWFSFRSPNLRPSNKTAGLACLSNNNITIYNTANSGLTSNQINDIAIDKNNKKWIATENCIISFDDSISKWEKHYNQDSYIRKIDTMKYNNDDQFIQNAKAAKPSINSSEGNIEENNISNKTDIQPSQNKHSNWTDSELPNYYNSIDILPTNEKIINSFNNGCCIYNDTKWDCDSLIYLDLILKKKFQLNENEYNLFSIQLMRILNTKALILQLIKGIDNSLWVLTNKNIFKITYDRIIEYDLFDKEIKYILDNDFKSKFYYIYQDKEGGIWTCINSAILKIE